jgi:uncharacterized protein (TIGR02246 family)
VAEGVAVTFASLPEHGVKGRIEMKRLAVFAALILALGLVLAQDQDEEAIDGLRQEWVAFYNEGDVAGVAELYAEDAVLYYADGTVHEGRDAIQEVLQSAIDAGFTGISAEAIETEIVNGTAYQVGSYTFMDDEGETVSEGYYLLILQRDNGEWRIHRHIGNMVLPAQELPEENGEDDAD